MPPAWSASRAILEAGSASAARRRAVRVPRRHRRAAQARRDRRAPGRRRSTERIEALRQRHAVIARHAARRRGAHEFVATLDAGLPRHRRHPAHRRADPLGVAARARPRRRLRRDLVDAAVRALPAAARPPRRAGALDRRARHRARWNGARSGRPCAGTSRARNADALVPRDRHAARSIITGFIARDARRACRRRSAATAATSPASIFGALLDAAEIHIWTDVDGVLSADPRLRAGRARSSTRCRTTRRWSSRTSARR